MMMQHKCRRGVSMRMLLLATLTLSCLVCSLSGVSAAQPKVAAVTPGVLSEAKSFIDKLSQEAIQWLTDPKLPIEERQRRFRTLFDQHFAVQNIARFALGKFRRFIPQGDRTQEAEYMKLYEDDITHTYAARFGQYKGEKIQIISATPGGGDGAILVNTQILQPNGNTVKVQWKVYSMEDGFKIFDIFIEGASMIAAQRDEFAAIMSQTSGAEGIQPLLDHLRQKLQNRQNTQPSAS